MNLLGWAEVKWICVWTSLIVLVSANNDLNVALNKPSEQSSTYNNEAQCYAAHANDGDFKTRSCTGENYGDDWWEVDLERSIRIKDVIIHVTSYPLKKDKYKQLVVYTRNSKFQDWKVCKDFGRGTISPFQIICDVPTKARYVRISLKNNANLYLQEVAIHEKTDDLNVALNKPSEQSSTYNNEAQCYAAHANDGDFKTRSCTGENNGDDWWGVDLKRSILIRDIIIYVTSYPLRKNKYKQLVVYTKSSKFQDWKVCKYFGRGIISPFQIICDVPTKARYVRISLKNIENLYLQEVLIREKTDEVNFALNKPSKQSSTYGGRTRSDCSAELANDGKFTTRSVTFENDGEDWWEVDLQETIYVKNVVVYLTAYAIKKRKYQKIVVFTREKESESWSVCKNVGKMEVTPFVVKCDRITKARYVRITLQNDSNLYLAEVEIHQMTPPAFPF